MSSPSNIRLRGASAHALVLILLASSLSGCTSTGDGPEEGIRESLVIAYEISPGIESLEGNPQLLADHLSESTNFDVSVFIVNSEVAMIEALRFGNADVAMMDSGSAWIGWNQYGLESLGADQKSDGRTYYNAHAWVLDDSEMAAAHLDDDTLTNPFSLMSGKTSCHTGWLKSTGMMVPMGFLLGLGYANVLGDPNDIESLRGTIHGFFNENSSIPEPGTPYYGFDGAIKCLSDQTGQIAFAKDNTIENLCPEGESIQREEWCLDSSRYVRLPSFAKVPSDTMMFNPDFMSPERLANVTDLFVGMGASQESSKILSDTLGTKGILPTNSSEHLGTYTPLVSNIPGISAYYTDDASEGQHETVTIDELRIAFDSDGTLNGTDYDPQLLADFLSSKLGITVKVHPVTSEAGKIDSLESGDAHIALMAPQSAWVGWKQHGLAVMAAVQNQEERTSHYPQAWVRSDGNIAAAFLDDDPATDPLSEMEGGTSCHTAWLDPTGMLMPMGHLIGSGYVQSEVLSDEIETLNGIILDHFSNESSIPEPDSLYFGPSGAIRCLSEGAGQVAFSTEGAVDESCNNADPEDDEEWCLDLDQYVSISVFGHIPSESVMYNPSTLDMRSRTAILNALIDLNYEMYLENYSRPGFGTYTGCYDISIHKVFSEIPKKSCGDEVLKNVLGGPGIVRASAQDHIGSFSESVRHIPGIVEYFEEAARLQD